MDIRPIRTEDDHKEALRLIEQLWNAEPGTPESDRLEVLVDLVEAYEDKHFPIPEGDPIDLLRAHMEMTGRTQADLAQLFGSAPRASEILNRKRALTVDMIHKLATQWGLPADALVVPYHLSAA
jgi:HTH-type transcriptional regulator/antitoxin HigA